MEGIRYVAKDELFPRFGCRVGNAVFVRKDLPACVRRSVAIHELYHARDPRQDGWLLREARANGHALVTYPWGWVATAVWSLAPYRLRFYAGKCARAAVGR